MTRSDALLCATDTIFDTRQWLTGIAERMPTDEGTEAMIRLELDLLRVEDMVGDEADAPEPTPGFMNQVSGILVPAVRS